MKNKKIKIIFWILVLGLGMAYFIYTKLNKPPVQNEIVKEIKPFRGDIENIISTTGTVFPKNRLEIKPPINGRIEEILVKEGDTVKQAETIAWMSSTERAALLDAARGQGEKQLKYWQEVYKAIPLISPIKGEVIVAKTQPGQTVTTSDAVIVLSDKLIVRAQVDETDIGKVRLGQDAILTLDAYPDNNIKANVQHIYYESKTVNNVTIYEVDLESEEVPGFFRSGMNATVNFIQERKEKALLIPLEAVVKNKDTSFVFVKQLDSKEPVRCAVKLGISDDKNVEVVAGIGINDVLILKAKKYMLPRATAGSNPFMPFRGKR